jgi:hypothetical protein
MPEYRDLPNPVGGQSALTGLSVAQAITIPDSANGVWVQALTQNVRFVIGTGTLSAASGFRLTAGNDVTLFVLPRGTTIRFIEETASARIEYQFVAVNNRGAS